MPSILFVCTANRFRSPIAAIYFAQKVVQQGDDQDFQISSAGTWTVSGQPATPNAVELGEAYDLNLSLHKSRLLTGEILSKADLVLVMEAGHKEAILHEFPSSKQRVFLLTEAVGLHPVNIPDPYSTTEPAPRVAEEIIELIDLGYQDLIDLAWEKAQDHQGNVN